MKVFWTAPQAPPEIDWVEIQVEESPIDVVIDPSQAWICNPLTSVNELYLARFPYLRYLITPSTGTNHIDLEACKERGIKVLSLLDDREALNEIRASSEFTFMLILMALRKVRAWSYIFQSKTHEEKDELYYRNEDTMRGNELYEKYVGIIGYGRIGKNIYDWLKVFGAFPYFLDPYVDASKNRAPMATKFTHDIVVICCSLTEETEGMITKEHLELMQPGAILVNTARAEIINQQDLEEWCAKGGTYVADVLHGETTGDHVNSPLLSLANCIITPHIAGTTFESQEKAAKIALNLLRKEIEHGKVRN